MIMNPMQEACMYLDLVNDENPGLNPGDEPTADDDDSTLLATDLEQDPQVDHDNGSGVVKGLSPVDLDKLAGIVKLDLLKTSLAFIQAIRVATLDDEHSKLDEETIHWLRNPPTEPIDVSEPSLHLGIDLFSVVSNVSQEMYTKV